jgi:prolyl-tRNA synthetase
LTKEAKDGIADLYISDLEQIQEDLFNKALITEIVITEVTILKSLKVLNDKGGFVSAHWDGTATEEKIKDLTKATIRCIPLDR